MSQVPKSIVCWIKKAKSSFGIRIGHFPARPTAATTLRKSSRGPGFFDGALRVSGWGGLDLFPVSDDEACKQYSAHRMYSAIARAGDALDPQ